VVLRGGAGAVHARTSGGPAGGPEPDRREGASTCPKGLKARAPVCHRQGPAQHPRRRTAISPGSGEAADPPVLGRGAQRRLLGVAERPRPRARPSGPTQSFGQACDVLTRLPLSGKQARAQHRRGRLRVVPSRRPVVRGETSAVPRERECGMNFERADCDRHSGNQRPASDYAVTRSPDAADLSIAAMTSWRRTASAKSGTV
jgi:hypothetical protein